MKLVNASSDYSRPARTLSWSLAAVAALGLLCASAAAQYVGAVKKPAKENGQLRAVAVLEWTGEAGKPKACRIVPVAIYDGEKLNDASLYMARPEPIALAGEVEYQLKQDGKTIGIFDIKNSGREQGSWVGYGEWKPAEKPKAAAPAPVEDPANNDDDKPILHRKKHTADDTPATPAESKSGSDSASKSQTTGNTSEAAPDPDQPTLHRQKDNSDDNDGPPKMKKAKPAKDVAHVDNLPGDTDPDRPRLVRGRSTAENLRVLPSLMGLPPDMEQAIAVSDQQNHPDHPWDYSWSNPDDAAKLKSQLEDMARAALGLNQPVPLTAPAPKPHPGPRSSRKAAPATPPPPPAELHNEQYRVFELAYGSGATMVLSADTGGDPQHQKFVTLIAQPDLYGNLNVLLKSVTDGDHLDETPQMRIIDAVDALADNRGELLFELRGATQRQFALYRVTRGQAEKLFAGSGGEYGSMSAIDQ